MTKFRFPRGTPFHKRFQPVDNGCWEWQGTRNAHGYGCYYPAMNVRFLAHRYAYELAYGPIPNDLCVLHRCDNPSCCNPNHLFLGTHQDNMADRQAKGRTRTGHFSGEAHPSAKFTAADVRTIRARVDGGETRTALAREYGVSLSTISLITRRLHYREVQ